MCDTCGCGQDGSQVKISKPGEVEANHHHDHTHAHGHDHSHDHPHDHQQSHDHPHDHNHNHGQRRIVLEEDILARNNLAASRNSGYFEAKGIVALNLMSSPGSGKTTLLERTIEELKGSRKVAVIEGDQQSMNDAERIDRTGVPVVQVNTGSGCHLDAEMIHQAVRKLEPEEGSLLFIENVGNLVCPSLFRLGERSRIVIVSVTEGDDKPQKYPTMFLHADLCIINKTDLLPYVDFELKRFRAHAMAVQPALEFIELSAKTGEGMAEWIEWISPSRFR
ncbi:MAG: hydrogenase nickel incorporation protein HypB [Bacteroidota bacterium]